MTPAKKFLSSYHPTSLIHLSSSKRANLETFFNRNALPGDRLMFLPYDHGLEHGPVDFLETPEALNPEYILNMAKEGNFSGVVLQIGYAEKYWQKKEFNSLPLVLKLNGKTNIPSDFDPISPLTSSVSDAVKLKASAVGYTLYVGSSRQAEDFDQFRWVRQEAEAAGLPLIVWAYPRGRYAKEQGGIHSLAMVAYAARTAAELGADLVKVNYPIDLDMYPTQHNLENYNDVKTLSDKERLAWIVASANIPCLLSGGEKTTDEELIKRTSTALLSGFSGIIFGRNMWKRTPSDVKKFLTDLRKTLSE